MAIKTQGSKIIRNLAGEILIESDALIDLRSTYGVIKGVGDEVDKITFYHKPIRFTNNTASCIENGDGFDFTGNTGHFTGGSIGDGVLEFTFQAWIRQPNPINPVNAERIISCDLTTSTRGAQFCINKGAGFYFYTGVGTQQLITNPENVLIPIDVTEWNHFAVTRDSESRVRLFINGYRIHNDPSVLDAPLSVPRKWLLGQLLNNSAAVFTQIMDDVSLTPTSIYNPVGGVNSKAFTPPKRSSDNE